MRVFSIFVLTSFACGGASSDDDDLPMVQELEVRGLWASNYGFDEEITASKWGTAAIIEYDNAENFVVTQQPADDMFNPNEFSKIVWTEPSLGRFWYCTVDFGLATADEARATAKSADATNPASGGCGGFPWTRLATPIEIAGSFSSMWGMESITSHVWGTATVVEYDNDTNVALTQWPADDMFNPNEFNKVVWTEPMSGRFFYCIVDFGRDTIEQARTSTQTFDSSDPATRGCGMFPWTELSRS
jgi:hypothetical protein